MHSCMLLLRHITTRTGSFFLYMYMMMIIIIVAYRCRFHSKRCLLRRHLYPDRKETTKKERLKMNE